ncbi:hypothetical protein [Pararhizobium sp. A13]|uniref:hypothetical protein n=1 Tax=Pararhizobium sp. A13 TaxID=3133975 RepID=UPI0032471410
MEIDWKLLVKEIKTSPAADRDVRLVDVFHEAAGRPLTLREALAGRPRLVTIEADAIVCILALPDLIEIVGGKGPTIGEMMDNMAARRPVRKTDTTGRTE